MFFCFVLYFFVGLVVFVFVYGWFLCGCGG